MTNRSGKPRAKKVNKAVAQQRTDDVLRILLDGAMLHDVISFVREKEKETGSPWFVEKDATPLSEAMIRKYIERGYELIDELHEKSRSRLLRRHVARLNHLYGRAMVSGELSVARAVLRDLAEAQRLLPKPEDELRAELAELRAMLTKGVAR
jgi:hypothetical protein